MKFAFKVVNSNAAGTADWGLTVIRAMIESFLDANAADSGYWGIDESFQQGGAFDYKDKGKIIYNLTSSTSSPAYTCFFKGSRGETAMLFACTGAFVVSSENGNSGVTHRLQIFFKDATDGISRSIMPCGCGVLLSKDKIALKNASNYSVVVCSQRTITIPLDACERNSNDGGSGYSIISMNSGTTGFVRIAYGIDGANIMSLYIPMGMTRLKIGIGGDIYKSVFGGEDIFGSAFLPLYPSSTTANQIDASHQLINIASESLQNGITSGIATGDSFFNQEITKSPTGTVVDAHTSFTALFATYSDEYAMNKNHGIRFWGTLDIKYIRVIGIASGGDSVRYRTFQDGAFCLVEGTTEIQDNHTDGSIIIAWDKTNVIPNT